MVFYNIQQVSLGVFVARLRAPFVKFQILASCLQMKFRDGSLIHHKVPPYGNAPIPPHQARGSGSCGD